MSASRTNSLNSHGSSLNGLSEGNIYNGSGVSVRTEYSLPTLHNETHHRNEYSPPYKLTNAPTTDLLEHKHSFDIVNIPVNSEQTLLNVPAYTTSKDLDDRVQYEQRLKYRYERSLSNVSAKASMAYKFYSVDNSPVVSERKYFTNDTFLEISENVNQENNSLTKEYPVLKYHQKSNGLDPEIGPDTNIKQVRGLCMTKHNTTIVPRTGGEMIQVLNCVSDDGKEICTMKVPNKADLQNYRTNSVDSTLQISEATKSKPSLPASSTSKRSKRHRQIEYEQVHQVYKQIAPHCDHVRQKAWPRVKRFLKEVEPGSMVVDVGCGNGRYLKINSSIYKLGCDLCPPFLDQARSQGHEVMLADNIALPYRDATFDAVISIGVIHHFSSLERRIRAISELSRILTPGGRLMIYVWAFEQIHRKFESQDILIPWVKPQVKDVTRRNTFSCSSECEAGSISTSVDDTEVSALRRHQRHEQQNSSSNSAGDRYRSKSLDSGESAMNGCRQNTVSSENSPSQKFGVFDKRETPHKAGRITRQDGMECDNSVLDDVSKCVEQKESQTTTGTEDFKAVTKWSGQLVSECKKLGKLLRSLSSKSDSQSNGDADLSDCVQGAANDLLVECSTDPDVELLYDLHVECSTDPDVELINDLLVECNTDPDVELINDLLVDCSTYPDVELINDLLVECSTDPDVELINDLLVEYNTDSNVELINDLLVEYNTDSNVELINDLLVDCSTYPDVELINDLPVDCSTDPNVDVINDLHVECSTDPDVDVINDLLVECNTDPDVELINDLLEACIENYGAKIPTGFRNDTDRIMTSQRCIDKYVCSDIKEADTAFEIDKMSPNHDLYCPCSVRSIAEKGSSVVSYCPSTIDNNSCKCDIYVDNIATPTNDYNVQTPLKSTSYASAALEKRSQISTIQDTNCISNNVPTCYSLHASNDNNKSTVVVCYSSSSILHQSINVYDNSNQNALVPRENELGNIPCDYDLSHYTALEPSSESYMTLATSESVACEEAITCHSDKTVTDIQLDIKTDFLLVDSQCLSATQNMIVTCEDDVDKLFEKHLDTSPGQQISHEATDRCTSYIQHKNIGDTKCQHFLDTCVNLVGGNFQTYKKNSEVSRSNTSTEVNYGASDLDDGTDFLDNDSVFSLKQDSTECRNQAMCQNNELNSVVYPTTNDDSDLQQGARSKLKKEIDIDNDTCDDDTKEPHIQQSSDNTKHKERYPDKVLPQELVPFRVTFKTLLHKLTDYFRLKSKPESKTFGCYTTGKRPAIKSMLDSCSSDNDTPVTSFSTHSSCYPGLFAASKDRAGIEKRVSTPEEEIYNTEKCNNSNDFEIINQTTQVASDIVQTMNKDTRCGSLTIGTPESIQDFGQDFINDVSKTSDHSMKDASKMSPSVDYTFTVENLSLVPVKKDSIINILSKKWSGLFNKETVDDHPRQASLHYSTSSLSSSDVNNETLQISILKNEQPTTSENILQNSGRLQRPNSLDFTKKRTRRKGRRPAPRRDYSEKVKKTQNVKLAKEPIVSRKIRTGMNKAEKIYRIMKEHCLFQTL